MIIVFHFASLQCFAAMMRADRAKGKKSRHERPSCRRAVIKRLRKAGPPLCRLLWAMVGIVFCGFRFPGTFLAP